MKMLTLLILSALTVGDADAQFLHNRITFKGATKATLDIAASAAIAEAAAGGCTPDRPCDILIGAGYYAATFVSFGSVPNLRILGAGTNKTFLIGSSASICDFADNIVLQNLTFVSNTVAFLANCTNVFMSNLRVLNEGNDTSAIFMDEFALNRVSAVASNCLFRGTYGAVELLGANSTGFRGRFSGYNCELQTSSTGAGGNAGNGYGLFSGSTNAAAYLKDCVIKISGCTNAAYALLADGGKIIADNCAIMIGTNGVRRDPATSCFSGWTTNAGAEIWFKNMSGQSTNSAGNGRFFPNAQHSLFPAPNNWYD
jgi:hypothetical protein